MDSLIDTSVPAAAGPQAQSEAQTVDVVVIGAGIAGVSAASVMAQQGHDVVLIDTHAVRAPEFRAEKVDGTVLARFDRLGLGAAVRQAMTRTDRIAVFRFDQFAGFNDRPEYSFAYSTLVNVLRTALPASVEFLIGRVADVATSPDRQTVTMANGRVLRPRLVVIATGHGDTIRRKVGIRAIELRRGHSLSLGFDIGRPVGALPFDSLTYYGSGSANRVSYITLFPIEARLRANLFVYRDVADPWTQRFRNAPNETLAETMPGFIDRFGSLDIAGDINVRPIPLAATEDYRRDGVVLLGDAFAITCPIPGHGMQRALTDVERLCCEYLPQWLAGDGMGADKISQFYDDPVKTANDAMAVRASQYSRSIVVDPGLIWTARRWRNGIVRRSLILARRPERMLAGSLQNASAGGRAMAN